MTPFVQELISFISLMLGVIVLTAWAMWLLLRPSGDTKVKNFAEESARDGLTQCVMENNELKNTVTRLEREIKVLMAAGYGKKKGEEPGTKDEALRTQGDGSQNEKKVVAEGVVVKPAVVSEKVNEAGKEVEEERGKGKGHESGTKDEGLRTKGDGPGHQKKVVAEDVVAKSVVQPTVRKDVPSKPLEKPVQKPAESEQTASAVEARRVVDEAEKKKIAEYLANVEKTQERHKKEVEALAAKAENAEKINYPDNNLKRIKGIGPHLEVKLKKSGITSFQQIAKLSEKDIKRIADEIGSFPRRIKREAWVEQARKILGKS